VDTQYARARVFPPTAGANGLSCVIGAFHDFMQNMDFLPVAKLIFDALEFPCSWRKTCFSSSK